MNRPLRIAFSLAVLFVLVGCDGPRPSPTDEYFELQPVATVPPELTAPVAPEVEPESSDCSEPKTSTLLPPIVENENPVSEMATFEALREEINSACASCHLAPGSKTGGFWYKDSHKQGEVRYNGTKQTVDGISEAASSIAKVLSNGRMPPENIRKAAPNKYQKLLSKVEDWIAAGKPTGTFQVRSVGDDGRASSRVKQSDLGTCIPRTDQIGTDPDMDEVFQKMTQLPEKLSQTDLFTLDSLALAKKGTLSYNVEYPLWADNAEKGRYVHFPAVWNEKEQQWKTSGATFNPDTKNLEIPPNTRFYKTFYKAVLDTSGNTVFRKIETRIIVVRKQPQSPLMGSYRWNDQETIATLVTNPYRDGSPWKDDIFKVVIDEVTGKQRKYAIPGRQRCVECHQGSADFVLGFTPLQLNRRAFGEAGRDRTIGDDEKTQIMRFLDAGILKNVRESSELPVLELSGASDPKNIHELRLQGYLVGNCAHCHNPDGFAMKENQVTLDLREGKLFNFDTRRITRDSVRSSPKYFVKPGVPQSSHIYLRVASSKIGDGGRFLPMPMHTPGDANCKLVNLTAKWIYSLSPDPTLAKKAETEPVVCQPNDDFNWIDLDLTWPVAKDYTPRRADWKDPINGMPEKYFKLEQDRRLQKLLSTPVPVDFWDRARAAGGQIEPKCEFPKKPQPRKPLAWMLDSSGSMKQPAGELYTVTPGAHFYNSTCAKCHGNTADGNSGLATNLLTLTGGAIRVANLKDGLFGIGNERVFDIIDTNNRKKNLAGQYMIWMAMEGTRVNFPPEMAPYVGRHKAQMLNQLRDRCKAFIATSPQKATERMKDYLAFKDVCFYRNSHPHDRRLQFDPSTDQPLNPEVLEAWADKAAINVGWAIYDYLKFEGGSGKWQPAKNECEKVYPVKSVE
jgi:hypothetical protein